MIRNDTLRRNPGKVSAVQSRSHRLLPEAQRMQPGTPRSAAESGLSLNSWIMQALERSV